MTTTCSSNNWVSFIEKKIEDAVLRAEISAPTAFELEEARRIRHEEIMRECNLWDDPAKSIEILNRYADSAKAIDALKDIKYKVEEAKLITQLAEVEGINCRLLEQAYNASLYANKLLDRYEMVKLLKVPYDMEGACVIIKAGSEGLNSEDSSACVDVVPLFLGTCFDIGINDEDLIIPSSLLSRVKISTTEPTVCIQHIPTGISVQSSQKMNFFFH